MAYINKVLDINIYKKYFINKDQVLLCKARSTEVKERGTTETGKKERIRPVLKTNRISRS